MVYKYNQYFDIEEVVEVGKLKIVSYYLDGMALYWHHNFMKGKNDQCISQNEYVEAICSRFGGQKDLLKELNDL